MLRYDKMANVVFFLIILAICYEVFALGGLLIAGLVLVKRGPK